MDRNKRWYVLYTSARAEKKVAERLAYEGFEVFLPVYRSRRKWSDRIKTVELPLFSSYVFVRCTEIRLRTALLVQGVVKVIYHCGKPAVVRDEEISEVREFLAMTDRNKVISIGDMVRILGGPFDMKYGKITRIDNRFAYLILESIGDVPVCLELCIEKDNITKPGPADRAG